MRTESTGILNQIWKDLGFLRILPVSSALLLPLVLASVAIFAISCQADDPTPTPVPPAPTATTAPDPTPTNTPAPTATEAPAPTATKAPEPKPTNTPAPTATKAPEPAPTNTPAPTATKAPDPTPTNTPAPTATKAPEPTPTNTPAPTATKAPDPTPAPTATKAPEPTPVAPAQELNADETVTFEYVQKAIDFYTQNGLAATRERYMTDESIEDNRTLILIDSDKNVLLVYKAVPTIVGQYVGPGSRFTSFQRLVNDATEEGHWSSAQGINRTTKQEEPRRVLTVLHGGLVFATSHSALRENVEDSTKEYVQKAIDLYKSDGLDATIAYYNSPESLDGQFYLFLIGADDIYKAHPIFPHLIGSDIKDVVGSDGQELGKEIALATDEGIWVEYLWPHPESRREQQKVTWAIRHDGLIFASGYYAGGSESGPPAWQDADPREYTKTYVETAIERYERDGLQSMIDYYNSVASFEGEWYLFATDENDIYHVHPLIPHLRGTDIKAVVGSDGYELGKELAKATDDEGVWVEYLWPHPVTLREVPKVGYAVRRDGMLFASGYYVQVEDPAAHTKAYVQEAIDYYASNGLDATIERYSDADSVDGQWNLTLADENNIVRVAFLSPTFVGTDLNTVGAGAARNIGAEMTAATEDGKWISSIFPNTRSSETLYAHTWVIRYDGLLFSSRYYDDEPDVPDSAKTDDARTRDYVNAAIDYYEQNGLAATRQRYMAEESIENGRSLILIDANNVLLVYEPIPTIVGQYVGPGSRFTSFLKLVNDASEEGHWSNAQGVNRTTKQEEPRRILSVLHGGLVFATSHSVLRENVEDSTKEYVQKAIDLYESDGLDATIAHYNSQESLDGQFYLFLIGDDDIYKAHPIFPHLIGTDIKDVVGSDGQELGKEIAQATDEGIWVEYLWPHPESRKEQQKVTWAIRHNGLIFASGYYAGGPESGKPAWQDADPREYTVDFVNRAIERYERDGLQSMIDYYNSVASFEGEWYLFATDENDIYHVHPLIPHLRGTDIKDVVGSDGYELGKELAKATEEGVWVEYLWPHPVTLKEAPKVGYAVRRDGMLFASGYYEQPEDPAAHTKAYVQRAIDYYAANGLDATIERYSDADSVDGQWNLTLADENDIIQVAFLSPSFVGTNLNDFGAGRIRNIGAEMAAATEDGEWISVIFPNTRSSETLYAHTWAIRYDGLLFSSRYYDDSPDVPESAQTDDALTRNYVAEAIAFYDQNGLAATRERYMTAESIENGRALTLIDSDKGVLLVYTTIPSIVGRRIEGLSGFQKLVGGATAEGSWSNAQGINRTTRQEEPRRIFAVVHNGLVFSSGHSVLRENVEVSTKEYVQRAIDHYDSEGLDATIAHYNSEESIEGQFYLFLIGDDDNYLAHPIFQHLIGSDIKDVVGSGGHELGKEIAQATEEGIWVEYLWPHPETRIERQKVTWAIRHEGLIFASGYYAGGPEEGYPAWQDADPREYTIDYVNRAIVKYGRDGLQSMIDYYNSVASFEGEWYLFATDENDIYHVHPLLPELRGTDIKDVVGSDGYELGKELAKATEGEGVWVEYLWPHPVTLKEVPKVGYAVRRDGLLFASGYYVQPEDPAAQTKAYVQRAIDYYEANGLDATIERYSDADSVEGQWNLTLADENNVLRVAFLSPNLVGANLTAGTGTIGAQMAAAGEDGAWISTIFPNTRSSETLYAHVWAIRHNGLLFSSRYYDDKPDVPETE